MSYFSVKIMCHFITWSSTVVSYQNESFSSKWEQPCLPPSSLQLWRSERASRHLSFWWKPLVLLGHYGDIKRGLTLLVVSGSIDGLFLRRFHSLLQNSEVLLHWRATHWHQLRPKHEGRLKSRTQLTPIPSQTFYYSETTQIAYKNAKMPLGAIIFPISIGKN